MKYTNWTSGQLSRLRKHYPLMPWDFLIAEFAPHSKGSIEYAAKGLGLKRKYQKWMARVAAHKPTIVFGPARL